MIGRRHRCERWARAVLGAVLSCTAGLTTLARASAPDLYVLSVDVPADLTGAPVLPGDVVLNEGNVYSVLRSLPALGALHALQHGLVYFSVAAPTLIGSTWLEPRDVAATDGLTTLVILSGSSAGIPEGSRIDGLYVDVEDTLYLSFDVPTRIGAADYLPSDIVAYSGGSFTSVWSGSARGVPLEANLVGVDADATGPIVSFDIPVTLGRTLFQPGSLISDTGGAFAAKNVDPLWPAGTQLRDFALVTGAGSVAPAGADALDVTYDKASNVLTLVWGASCAANDADFEVYEGTLGGGSAFSYNHSPRYCSTGGLTTASFTPPETSTYYLVVPQNGLFEGSYGAASNGAEIPQGGPNCLPQKSMTVCQRPGSDLDLAPEGPQVAGLGREKSLTLTGIPRSPATACRWGPRPGRGRRAR